MLQSSTASASNKEPRSRAFFNARASSLLLPGIDHDEVSRAFSGRFSAATGMSSLWLGNGAGGSAARALVADAGPLLKSGELVEAGLRHGTCDTRFAVALPVRRQLNPAASHGLLRLALFAS